MTSYWSRRARGTVNATLARSGMRLVRTGASVLDLRAMTTDPIEAQYRAGLRPFLLTVPLTHCRILPGAGFACLKGVGNPFVDALEVTETAGYAASPLKAFYDAWQPRSAADVLGLPDHTVLAKADPLAFVMPWQDRTPEQSRRRWLEMIEKDNREHGTGDAHGQGWKGWGPVSEAIARQEFDRLHKVKTSIERSGYRRSDDDDGDVKGTVLWNGETRVVISAGHHRAAAMAALGHADLPVRIDNPVVRRTDVAAWPNVRSGLFTAEEALALFDRLFEARQPQGYRP